MCIIITPLVQFFKKFQKYLCKLLFLPFLLFGNDLFASCSMENFTAIDFDDVSVSNNTQTGDIIQTRNATYLFRCSPNSSRIEILDFDINRAGRNITFSRDSLSFKLFDGIDMRITITDQLGEKHVISPDSRSTHIYSVTDNDLKNGFDWRYNVQVDLIRTNEALPKTYQPKGTYARIAHFGSNRNPLSIENHGSLYVRSALIAKLNTCNITLPDSLTLPDLNIIDLERLPLNGSLSATDFNISIHCETNTNASIRFHSVYDGLGTRLRSPYALAATPNSTAEGVNFILRHNNQPITLSRQIYERTMRAEVENPPTIDISLPLRQFIPKDSTISIPLQVAYYKTAPQVSPGYLGGAITISVVYN